jgi:uncharacterized protein YjiS (DUF1127 family)
MSIIGPSGVQRMTAKTVTSMRYQQTPALAQAELTAAVLRAIRATADRARWALWRWYQMRRTSHQLAGLQDHILRDIGLSRMTLQSATMRRVREEEEFRRRFGSC